MSMSNDGSESVDQFLARIASVKEGRDEASEERKRRMEDEFLKNRTERQARRLERARSLSPSKTGPSTPQYIATTPVISKDNAIDPPIDFSPQNSTLARSNATRTSPTLGPKRSETDQPLTAPVSKSPTLSTTSLARSGTLSWQQRRGGEGTAGRPRPLSTIATVRPSFATDQPEPSSPKEQSRSDIAAALGQKDPSWFRQTQDRGAKSAAYRKNQVEDSPVLDSSAKSMRLPGLSRDDTQRGYAQSSPQSSPSMQGLPRPNPDFPQSLATTSQAKTALSPSPVMIEKPIPKAEALASDGPQPSVPRSPSPTKGLGGFVQSAMMRRSDSVSKRWTVQAGSGLQRGDSVAGTRPRSGMQASWKGQSSKEIGSSDPKIPSPQSPGHNENLSESARTQLEKSSHHVVNPERPTTPPERESLNRSPSKTLDTRRWSPTKSSWLESTLLATQEPPKLSPKKEEQPQWMVNLQRSRSRKDRSPERSGLDAKDPDPMISQSEILSASQLAADRQKQDVLPTNQHLQSVNAVDTDHALSETKQPLSKPADSIQRPAKVHTEMIENTQDGAMRQPPTLKPKPRAQPATDFRATLKTRAAAIGSSKDPEPEFKAVFGKLKPATTKNYVAPDTLKDNILSGKAALALTDGPQKSQRVDEFKESILQKKEAMKTGAGEKQLHASKQPIKPQSPLPEALQRRKTLHKTTPSVTNIQDGSKPVEFVEQSKPKPVTSPKPQILDTRKGTMQTPSSAHREGSSSPEKHIASPKAEQTITKDQGNQHVDENFGPGAQATKPREQSMLSKRQPAHETSKNTDQFVSLPRVMPDKPESTLLLAKQSGLPPGSKLASRLNPNLAALISRGTSPKTAGDVNGLLETPISSEHASDRATPNKTEPSGGELTHMTKGRARGPKRRAPKSQPESSKPTPIKSQASQAIKISEMPEQLPSTPASPMKSIAQLKSTFMSQSPEPTSFDLPADKNSASSPRQLPGIKLDSKPRLVDNPTPKVKPIVATKSPDLRKVSSPPTSAADDARPATPKDFKIAIDKIDSSVRDSNHSTPIVLGRTIHRPGPVESPKPLTPTKSRINTPKQPVLQKPTVSHTTKGPGVAAKVVSETTIPVESSTQARFPDKVNKNLDFVQHYFSSSRPASKDKAEFDTPALLKGATVESEKCKTLKNTIWELSGDGKKTPMPPQQEHILYEDCMYLMVHTLENNGGKSSEVFLWCGDKVPNAAVEDVQIFCRKDAREHNAKLDVLKQGKEPASFFQALGGIVITRRSKLSALYMLCGRKHLGHIAFDEVDFAIESLCSGFPYLISAKFGSLYLWKGKGSAVDEVGCARLIGMDLGLTGEIEEVDEGEEPASFWEAFSNPSAKRNKSPTWQQRNEHEAYPCFLYRVEHERPKSAGGFWGLRSASPPKTVTKAAVELVTPFCQRDLEQGNIYILDAYHSVYVLLDQRSSLKPAECATALHLAQEIAMLSPTLQRRSLLPTCHVAFNELPLEATSCFRKWVPTSTQSADKGTCMKLEDVMQVLGM